MRKCRRGTTLLEFTLTGIPVVLLSISIVECSLAMYEYESMANTVTIAARYAASHGASCSQNGNSCTITIANVANLIAGQAPILDATRVNVTLTDNSGSTTCVLNSCETNSNQFPSSTSNANAVGNPVTINITYKIRNPMPMFWPPANSDLSGYTVQANSIQVIQF